MDRTVTTPSEIFDMVLAWRALGSEGGDLDTYLTDQLRGRVVESAKGLATVFSVMNAGFSGHAIHGWTVEGHDHVIAAHIRL